MTNAAAIVTAVDCGGHMAWQRGGLRWAAYMHAQFCLSEVGSTLPKLQLFDVAARGRSREAEHSGVMGSGVRHLGRMPEHVPFSPGPVMAGQGCGGGQPAATSVGQDHTKWLARQMRCRVRAGGSSG